MPNRPSCYNCGEGGHTAPDCRRDKPIAVRNERQPGHSERSVTASYYGYDDDYGSYNGCASLGRGLPLLSAALACKYHL
jgi:Zinc knuckle